MGVFLTLVHDLRRVATWEKLALRKRLQPKKIKTPKGASKKEKTEIQPRGGRGLFTAYTHSAQLATECQWPVGYRARASCIATRL
jgi:hypothetical protein